MCFLSNLIRDGVRGGVLLVSSLLGNAERWLIAEKHATYGLSVARMLLGCAILGTLLTNFSTRLYTFGPGAAWSGEQIYPVNDLARTFPVSIIVALIQSGGAAFTITYIALILLTLCFILGFRTRLVMIPLTLLFVAIVESNDLVGDQSDNLVRIALTIMFFADPAKRWSLDALLARERQMGGSPQRRFMLAQPIWPAWLTNAVHNFAIVLIACQVSFIYVAGGLYKAGGNPWSSGHAIYDPIHVRQFGPWPGLSDFVTAWGPGVAFATALTLLVQVSFPLLLLRRGTRIFALVTMLGFHLGIAVLMGLPWFSLAMVALDAIFIRDVTWLAIRDGLRTRWRDARRRKSTAGHEHSTAARSKDSLSTVKETPLPEPGASPLQLQPAAKDHLENT